MNKVLVSYRQGDVLIVQVNRVPEGGQPVRENDDIVFAHGEVTGHAHRIVAPGNNAVLLDVQAERYLQVISKVTITHEEHALIVLREGKYQQAFQVQERGEEVRRVED